MGIEDASFDDSTFSQNRERLLEHDVDRQFFELFALLLEGIDLLTLVLSRGIGLGSRVPRISREHHHAWEGTFMNKTKITLLSLVVALMSPIGIASCGSSTPDQREEKRPILQSERQAVHHQEVTLNLSGGSVVAIPNIIGVQSGDIVEFESRDGEPDIAFDPPSAIRLDHKTEHSERITVLQAPFEFYCGLIVRG